jgi:hypothetical protein
MPSMNRRRKTGARRVPAAQAFLRLAEGDADLDGARPSASRRAAALGFALLFLLAIPLLWATSAQGGDEPPSAVLASSNSGPGSEDDDEAADGDGDGDDDTDSNGVTSGGQSATSTGAGDANTTGVEDTTTGATDTTVGDGVSDTGTSDTADEPGVTDTGTTDGDLVLEANDQVKAGNAVKVSASCAAGCEVVAQATFKGPSGSASAAGGKAIKTKKVSKSIAAGASKTLKLKLGSKAKRKLQRAARKKAFRKRARVVVKVAAGSQSEKLKLRLK